MPFRGKWVLLDGDKIAALCAAFIHEELAKLGLDKVVTAKKDISCLCYYFLVRGGLCCTPNQIGHGKADGGKGIVKACIYVLLQVHAHKGVGKRGKVDEMSKYLPVNGVRISFHARTRSVHRNPHQQVHSS